MALKKEILNSQELKSSLFTKLSKEGKLDKLRASIRSEIIGCFYSNRMDNQQERQPIDCSSSESLKSINWLIEEHLTRNHLEFTRSVFNLERRPKPSDTDKLMLIDILNALNIFPSSKLGTKIMQLFLDNNDVLFLWKVLQTLANHKDNEDNSTIPAERVEIDRKVEGSLYQKLKLIDEMYDKRKATSNHLISNEINHLENFQKVNNFKIKSESAKNKIEKNKNSFVDPLEKSIGLLLTNRRMIHQHNEIGTQEKLVMDFQKENEIQRLNLEMKWKEIDRRYLELNNLQERFALREKQLVYREQQLNETALELKRITEESDKKNAYNNNLEKDHLFHLRKEYDGKLKDALTQVQYFKNKVFEVEGLYQDQNIKHQQQCIFFNEKLKLQHERILYLQGVIQDYQNHMSIRNASIWNESFPKFMKTLDPMIGADLQETYFDTSLNASHLAPELELNDKQRNLSELPMFGDFNTIRSRLRELDSEADQLEYNYSKLEKSDFEENYFNTGNFSSPEKFSFNKKPSHFQISFEDAYLNHSYGDVDRALSKNIENPQTYLKDSQHEIPTESPTGSPTEILKTIFVPEKIKDKDSMNKKNGDAKSASQEEILESITKEVDKTKSIAPKSVAQEKAISKSVAQEKAISKSVAQEKAISKSVAQEKAISKSVVQLKDELKSLVVSPIINSVKLVEDHDEKHINSLKINKKDSMSEDDCSSRLSPRSSTPIENIGTPTNDRKIDFERNEDDAIKETISWEKASGGSDNEFEW